MMKGTPTSATVHPAAKCTAGRVNTAHIAVLWDGAEVCYVERCSDYASAVRTAQRILEKNGHIVTGVADEDYDYADYRRQYCRYKSWRAEQRKKQN